MTEIFMTLEEKFDITLDEEVTEKVATVQDAADLICTQVGCTKRHLHPAHQLLALSALSPAR